MHRILFLTIAAAAALALTPQSQAQTAQEQKPLTCQIDEAGMETALMRRISGGLGVTLGDYKSCVDFCKSTFPNDSAALVECVKGCKDVKAAPTAVILR